nr:T-cell receptor delta chain [Notamacropus eugenii]
MLLLSLLWPLTVFTCLGWSTAQTDTQSPPVVSVQEMGHVTLDCVYTTSYTTYYLYWYRQSPNGKLIYILHQYSESRNAKTGRYSVNLNKNAKSISLKISPSRLEDSGTYFCGYPKAQLGGYQGTLIFGSGTHLEVVPENQNPSTPSVFVMKNGTNVACLVKDFYPKSVDIHLPPEGKVIEGVVTTANGKFSAVKLGQYKQDLEQVKCTVKHNNNTVEAFYKMSHENSTEKSSDLEASIDQQSSSQKCHKSTVQIEKVNLLSITLLGAPCAARQEHCCQLFLDYQVFFTLR